MSRYWVDVRLGCVAVRDGSINEILSVLNEDDESVILLYYNSTVETQAKANMHCQRFNEVENEKNKNKTV